MATLCCPGFFQAPSGTKNATRLEKYGRIFHTVFIYFVTGIMYFGIGQLLQMDLLIQVIKSAHFEDDSNIIWIYIMATYGAGAILHICLTVLYYKVKIQCFLNFENPFKFPDIFFSSLDMT